ncbi:MAG: hypothetical protein DRP62_01585 [Planctomycetota bacterium]|nr:MAG: hypothetical protein DRP62_01585 [Planctomycetota bacterium]
MDVKIVKLQLNKKEFARELGKVRDLRRISRELIFIEAVLYSMTDNNREKIKELVPPSYELFSVVPSYKYDDEFYFIFVNKSKEKKDEPES